MTLTAFHSHFSDTFDTYDLTLHYRQADSIGEDDFPSVIWAEFRGFGYNIRIDEVMEETVSWTSDMTNEIETLLDKLYKTLTEKVGQAKREKR